MFHRHAHSRKGAFHHPGSYDKLSSRHARRLHARVVDDVVAVGLPGDARVLDVGTGPGRVPLAIAERAAGVHVEGIDLSEEMIAYARGLAADAGVPDRVSFAVEDVAALSYPDDSFDLVVSTLSQHHWADRAAGVRELLRVTRPTGQIRIYDIRFALRRAVAAAEAAGAEVRRDTVRTGRFSLGLITRLTFRPSPSHAPSPRTQG
ncbi:MAG: class I SAM-dependent methyltransferase [Micromonosporaceae bacterium]